MVPASTAEWTITPLEPKTWKGPRNTPKPDARKKKRQEAKAKRKTNRGVYSGR
jgi:hypothetical protein